MLTLMTAALAAAQPAPAANPHAHHAQMPAQGQMAPMPQHQHHAMKDGCPCCKNMGKGEHDMRAPGARPQGRRGQ